MTSPTDALQAMTAVADKSAEEWKGRADDAGFMSRMWLALRAAPPSSDARAVALAVWDEAIKAMSGLCHRSGIAYPHNSKAREVAMALKYQIRDQQFPASAFAATLPQSVVNDTAKPSSEKDRPSPTWEEVDAIRKGKSDIDLAEEIWQLRRELAGAYELLHKTEDEKMALRSATPASVAFEAGYAACERGEHFQYALDKAFAATEKRNKA
jgi:hypothetical protein